MVKIDINDIIKEAIEFECCPYCGSQDLIGGGHLCNSCKERIACPTDAYYFAKYLEKKYKGVEQGK